MGKSLSLESLSKEVILLVTSPPRAISSLQVFIYFQSVCLFLWALIANKCKSILGTLFNGLQMNYKVMLAII